MKNIVLTLGALSTSFLIACNSSSTNDGRIDYCRTGFMDAFKMEVNGSKKVNLDGDVNEVKEANLSLDAAEIFVHDEARDIRFRIVQRKSEKPDANNYSFKCIGGKGIHKDMEPFQITIPVVDVLDIDATGKTSYSYSNLVITLDNKPGPLLKTQLNTGSKGQGSLKTVYNSFEDLEQFYFYGDHQQIRNTMEKIQDADRNSSTSKIEIRTIQQFKTTEIETESNP